MTALNAGGGIYPPTVFGPAGLISAGTLSEELLTFDPSGNAAVSKFSDGYYDRYTYEGYGSSHSTFRFAGQWGGYTDSETGLVLMGYRYYDPGTGRFLTKDPIGFAGGINLYGYAGNNPVNFMDPLGLWGIQIGENGPNFGWGDPWAIFTGEDAVAGLGVGAAAVGSSFSLGFWDGGQAACDPSFGISHALGNIGRDALFQIGFAGVARGVPALTNWWLRGSEIAGGGVAREVGALSVSNALNDKLIGLGLATDAERGAYYSKHAWELLRNLRPNFAFGKLIGTGPTPAARAFLKALYVVGPQAGQVYYDRDLWLGRR